MLRARKKEVFFTTLTKPRFVSKLWTCPNNASQSASFSFTTKKTRKQFNCSRALTSMHKWSIKCINIQSKLIIQKSLTSRILGWKTTINQTYYIINRLLIIITIAYSSKNLLKTNSNVLPTGSSTQGLLTIFRLLSNLMNSTKILKIINMRNVKNLNIKTLKSREYRKITLRSKLRIIFHTSDIKKRTKPLNYKNKLLHFPISILHLTRTMS